jgi:hypothetical protein
MQVVSAFFRPQTIRPVSPAVPKRNLWMVSWRHLILYVGPPVLILRFFANAQTRGSAQEIYLVLAAFGESAADNLHFAASAGNAGASAR